MSHLDWIGTFGLTTDRLPQKHINRFQGEKAIVAGSAACVWDDLDTLGYRPNQQQWRVCAINDLIMHFPGQIAFAYSNDYKMLPAWMAARRPQYLEHTNLPEVHSVGPCPNRWPWPGHGSSALSAVYTMLAMGFKQVVLCGVPLDDSPHYWQAPWEKANFCREVGTTPNGDMQYWANAARHIFNGRVKSISGRTKELLGEPT